MFNEIRLRLSIIGIVIGTIVQGIRTVLNNRELRKPSGISWESSVFIRPENSNCGSVYSCQSCELYSRLIYIGFQTWFVTPIVCGFWHSRNEFYNKFLSCCKLQVSILQFYKIVNIYVLLQFPGSHMYASKIHLFLPSMRFKRQSSRGIPFIT